MKNKKIFKWFLWIIIALVILYFIIKSILIIGYNYAFNSLKQAIVEEKNISNVFINNEDYYTFDKLSIKNDFKNFEFGQNTENSIFFKSNDNKNKSFAILINVVDLIEETYNSDNKNYENFKKVGMQNEYGMYKEIYENKKIRLVSHFDSLRKILYLNSLLPMDELLMISKNYKITFGDIGDIKYLLTDYNNKKYIFLYKENKIQCEIIFENYEEKEIFDLLSTIKID